ncbi:N-acetyltransferase GCN5 [Burkholderia sp. 8Y]|uniref:GNAT family N-acetyltransferase n=1 Tax=Burkholderia sp. 8Y TaxID=2653133 RepID=UPI0012F18384|nr:GNAT family N-acetyltransferase [Burkholderia sp. 8Y]VXC96531.1 N-acetyltransferase GCN5 [Burkholderia sp. 8Y]
MSSAQLASTLTYRPFSAGDIPAAHGLSLEVKWPHRAEDWRFGLDTGAGFAAEENGRLVGTALYWEYGENGGSLGLVIVAPDWQGRGIGRKLMELLLDALGERVTVLHATPAGEPLYAKLGFERIGELLQHQSADFVVPGVTLPPGERIRAMQAADAVTIADLASRASGLDRAALMSSLSRLARGVVIERGGDVLGFSLMRPFGRGHAIGPVVSLTADGAHIQRAQALIAHWLAVNDGKFTRIDVPGECGLSAWLDGLGLKRVDTVVRMSRNGTPKSDESVMQFAIINQAQG